jgi:hypothetical protein
MSSVYESIIELTETLVSYWTTTTGIAYETTLTESGAVESAGGGGVKALRWVNGLLQEMAAVRMHGRILAPPLRPLTMPLSRL